MLQHRGMLEILKVKDADIVASYGMDFYAGTPAVTRKRSGMGEAWYIGARLDQAGMEKIYRTCLTEAGAAVMELPEGVEYRVRSDGEHDYAFYLNETDHEAALPDASGVDLLTGKRAEGLTLRAYEAAVLESDAL